MAHKSAARTLAALWTAAACVVAVSSLRFDGIRQLQSSSSTTAWVVSAMDTNGGTTCIVSRGYLYCTGLNAAYYYQRGIGDPSSMEPMQVLGVSDVVSVHCSRGGNQFAVTSNGSVYSWGSNYYGQLGTGSGGRSLPELFTGLPTQVKFLVAGTLHTCAVLVDGTMYCWGQNDYYQLGDGTNVDRPTPVQVAGLSNVRSGAAGYFFTCANLEDNTMFCWGDNADGSLGDGTQVSRTSPTQVIGLPPASQIAASYSGQVCAISVTADLYCWGRSSRGQLGLGTNVRQLTPAQVPGMSDVVQVVASDEVTMAVVRNGTGYAWGYNDQGQLGLGDFVDRNLPTPISGGIEFAGLAGTSFTSCGYTPRGSAYCWGGSFRGALFDGASLTARLPTRVQLVQHADSILIGSQHVCVHRNAGVQCWGYGSDGQLGHGRWEYSYDLVQPIGLASGVMKLSVGAFSNAVIMTDGTVRTWGRNTYGGLGHSGYTSSAVPLTVPGVAGAVDVDTYLGITCAVLSTGTAMCWGGNFYGALGRPQLTGNDPRPVPGLSNLVNISVSNYHACVLNSTGSVFCWGRNSDGEVGAGNVVNAYDAKVHVAGLPEVVAIKVDASSSCAVTRGHDLYCWGSSQNGKLGYGGEDDQPSPILITSNVTAVSDLMYTACVIKIDGLIYCWGNDWEGELGRGNYFHRTRAPALPVSLAGRAVQVSQGTNVGCAVMDDRSAYCWGSNYAALMGSGEAPSFEPQLILGSSVELHMTAPRCPELVGYEPTSACAGVNQVLQFTSNSLIYTHLLNFSVIQGCTPGMLSTIAPNRTITLPCTLASTASAQVCVDAAALLPGRDISVYSPGSMQCGAIRPSPSPSPTASPSASPSASGQPGGGVNLGASEADSGTGIPSTWLMALVAAGFLGAALLALGAMARHRKQRAEEGTRLADSMPVNKVHASSDGMLDDDVGTQPSPSARVQPVEQVVLSGHGDAWASPRFVDDGV